MKQRIFTLIAIFCFALSPLISEASHFRYGHITWTRTPGTRTVTFTITTAWRYDATESFDFNFGDGSSLVTGQLGTEILYVPNDYRVFQLQLTHTICYRCSIYSVFQLLLSYFNFTKRG
jgi:hypothetical protein